MKKKALSLFLALLLLFAILPGSTAAKFDDISDPTTALAAAALESMGIVKGISENKFAPNQRLTRAEFCAIAVRALGLEDEVPFHSYRTIFSDVQPGSWYTGYVNLAYTKGIINGYGDGRFGPEDGVNYGQAATILLRLLGYTAKDIGNSWPSDYFYFANNLGLQKGLWLNADTPLTRGHAAVIVYNTLGTRTKGGAYYYSTIKGVAYTREAIVLNTDAKNAGHTGLLMVCELGASPSIEYHNQKIQLSGTLSGYRGRLLFDSSGKSIGFIPADSGFMDITVAAAGPGGITSSTGATHKIPASAQVIYNGSLYAYGGGGYIQVERQIGRSVRLFYDENGNITVVYISAGSGSGAAYAETHNAASELARKLGISTLIYSVSKNGAAATANDLARYDVAYYDAATRTMRVSDFKITGYIEEAFPNISTAKTLTIAGCSLEVLESALSTLKNFSLGSYVTLLLTDDCKVAAVYPASTVSANMIGILSLDGKSVRLCDSGLVLTSNIVSAMPGLRGSLVQVSTSTRSELICYPYTPNDSSYQLDIANGKLGPYKLAPGCSIYEWTGDTTIRGYVHSLSGVPGESSSNLSEITWTDTLSSWYISYYRLNSAGQVDILLLKDVTGNCYEYGRLSIHSGQSGINLGTPGMPAYNDAAVITNGDYPNGSPKYLWTRYTSVTYNGISLAPHISGYSIVASVAELTAVPSLGAQAFFRYGDRWYAAAGGYEMPLSPKVQVYIKATGKWYSGETGISTALTSGMPLTVYYDRTPGTGAQIRVIVAEEL